MKSLFFMFILILSQSCGDLYQETDDDIIETKYEKINNIKNHIKLISPSITNSIDPATAHQYSYRLNKSSRLLVKLIGYNEKQADAIVNDENKAYIVLKIKNYVAEDEKHIKICPLTSNWAINATWDYYLRHRFSSRRWRNAGGDFAEDSCLEGTLQTDNALYFEVNDWILNYRNSITENFGFIVTASKNIEIYGDAHPNYSPQFRWFTK